MRIPGESGCSGGGRRGAITGFSAESRNRLLHLVNSIDQEASRPEEFRFVTLTYPKQAPTPRQAKQHLHNVIRRFVRAYGRRAILWKIEPQRRGAPHFHLLILMGDPATYPGELAWWVENWCQVIGVEGLELLKVSQVHLGGVGNRPCVEVVNSWAAVASYVGKYLGKLVDCETNEDGWAFPGRWWGVRHVELLPITRQVVELPKAAAAKIRRVLVAWYERQETAFVKIWARREFRDGSKSPHQWCRIPKKEAERLAAMTDVRVRPCRRRWRSSRGGIGCFLAEKEFLRVCKWACEAVGLNWSYEYGKRTRCDHCGESGDLGGGLLLSFDPDTGEVLEGEAALPPF